MLVNVKGVRMIKMSPDDYDETETLDDFIDYMFGDDVDVGDLIQWIDVSELSAFEYDVWSTHWFESDDSSKYAKRMKKGRKVPFNDEYWNLAPLGKHNMDESIYNEDGSLKDKSYYDFEYIKRMGAEFRAGREDEWKNPNYWMDSRP